MEIFNHLLVWILFDLNLTLSFLSILSFAETHLPNGNVLGPCRSLTFECYRDLEF